MIGIKVFINEIGGGLVEVMAIGTAIRKQRRRARRRATQLIPQAIIRDRDTFFDRDLQPAAQSLERK